MKVGPGLDRVASGISEWEEDILVEEVKNEVTEGGGGACGIDKSKRSCGQGNSIPTRFDGLPCCGSVVM